MIRGEELDLAELEKAWEAIATQTSWKLEPLLRFDNHDKTTSPTSEQELQGTQLNVVPVVVPTVSPNNNECDNPCGSEYIDVTIQESNTSVTGELPAVKNVGSRATNANKSTLANDSFLSNNTQLSFLDKNNA